MAGKNIDRSQGFCQPVRKLLKGISGAADLKGNQRITYAELYEFVSDRHDGVPYYARRLHGRVQNPVIKGMGKDAVFVSFAQK